ncbi:protein of unknown function [Methanoculleus bourgensis]|uniref:Uncharacterized protein n=1 Tax=Methanoculleus bourgensis TaxID=83986 RepID=A0A0X8XYH9_9EURY|nr:protein of unknown function [Methanoculleus bourgensis]
MVRDAWQRMPYVMLQLQWSHVFSDMVSSRTGEGE